MKGSVKFFNTTKGFGFISGEDNNDYFVHISWLSNNFTPKENDVVEFEVESGPRGLKAINVSKC